jgi:hypothetical protein
MNLLPCEMIKVYFLAAALSSGNDSKPTDGDMDMDLNFRKQFSTCATYHLRNVVIQPC